MTTTNAIEVGGQMVEVLRPDEGASYAVGGFRFRPIVKGEDSAGLYTMIEVAVDAGIASPRHICHREHKTLYVLDGALVVRVGDRELMVGPATTVKIPAGVAHEFRNDGPQTARMLVTMTPSGHEDFCAELSRIRTDSTAEFSPILARYRMELC